MQKKKGTRKGKVEVSKRKELFQKLNDDEKNDLVGQEVELVQTEIEQVREVQNPFPNQETSRFEFNLQLTLKKTLVLLSK